MKDVNFIEEADAGRIVPQHIDELAVVGLRTHSHCKHDNLLITAIMMMTATTITGICTLR